MGDMVRQLLIGNSCSSCSRCRRRSFAVEHVMNVHLYSPGGLKQVENYVDEVVVNLRLFHSSAAWLDLAEAE